MNEVYASHFFKPVLREYLIFKAVDESSNLDFLVNKACPPACPDCCASSMFKSLVDFDFFTNLVSDLVKVPELINGFNEINKKYVLGLEESSLSSVLDLSIKRLIIDDNPIVGSQDEFSVKLSNDNFMFCPFYFGKCSIYDFSRPKTCKVFHCGDFFSLSCTERREIYDYFKAEVLPYLCSNERISVFDSWRSDFRELSRMHGKELSAYLSYLKSNLVSYY